MIDFDLIEMIPSSSVPKRKSTVKIHRRFVVLFVIQVAATICFLEGHVSIFLQSLEVVAN